MTKMIALMYLLLSFTIMTVSATSNDLDMWSIEKEIIVTNDSEYKEIMLDKEVYRHSNNDLSDLLIRKLLISIIG